MISLRTIPFMVSTFAELGAWLQVQNIKLAHDHEIPQGWKLVTLAPVGCVIMSTPQRKATTLEASIGFELLPDSPKPSLLRGKTCMPLNFEDVGFLPSGQYVLVRVLEDAKAAQ